MGETDKMEGDGGGGGRGEIMSSGANSFLFKKNLEVVNEVFSNAIFTYKHSKKYSVFQEHWISTLHNLEKLSTKGLT